mmetsp:Transcript_78306/g.123258  ORF Transcript_78306/g.123258 Transcript_78306/m.123258 type:complete len:239 (+) Transcript_78306:1652-2368(+)
MPFIGPSAAFLIALVMSSMVADFSRRQVKSTTDTSGVGTRKAIPVSLPFIVGITLPTALAAPVEDGMMFSEAQRPPRQSFPPRDGPSTVSCVAVMAWTVVIKPSTMPKLSLMTFASGARQLVVQDALETTVRSLVYFSWLTPITNIGVLSLGGAEMMTFLHPPCKCLDAFSLSQNTPVDSQTYMAPTWPQGICAGSFSWKTRTFIPLTTKYSAVPSFLVVTVPLNLLCTESYLRRYCM